MLQIDIERGLMIYSSEGIMWKWYFHLFLSTLFAEINKYSYEIVEVLKIHI